MAPTKHLAIVTNGDGTVSLKSIDVPKPGPGEILVKVAAAAQNPTDWYVPYAKYPADIVASQTHTGKPFRGSKYQVLCRDAISRAQLKL